ncbi:MAG TPA: mechanosensitive ion channel, partial [Pirellulales bacterium]|nr:mechanosensitive ion channel [Pirellulales bacterium]
IVLLGAASFLAIGFMLASAFPAMIVYAQELISGKVGTVSGLFFGLAFGLGGRDVMAGILAGYYLRQRMHAGDRIHVAGLEGSVREVGPVATVIETEEEGLLNRHSIPNTRMLNEAVR